MQKTFLSPFMRSHWILATLYFVILILVGNALGAFDNVADEGGIRIRNAAIAMPLITVYAFIGTLFLLQHADKSLHAMSAITGSQGEATRKLLKFDRAITRIGYGSAIFGLSMTGIYLYTEGLLVEALDPLILFMNLTAIPFWSALSYLVFSLFFTTRFVIANFLDRENLDLIGHKDLKPVSDLVIYNTAICAGFLALTPIFWLGKSIPLIDLYVVCVVFVGFVLYLFLPVFNVHFALSSQKKLAIERINFSIRQLMLLHNIKSESAFFDCPEKLRKLASLIGEKKEINAASEWPIDLQQGLKGLLITAGIPLSWAAVSLIESYLEKLNLFG